MSPDSHHLVPPAGWLDETGPDDEGPSPGFLLGVTLLAAALRLFEITGPSLWVDEILTWRESWPFRCSPRWREGSYPAGRPDWPCFFSP
jgi:hypothetical protein